LELDQVKTSTILRKLLEEFWIRKFILNLPCKFLEFSYEFALQKLENLHLYKDFKEPVSHIINSTELYTDPVVLQIKSFFASVSSLTNLRYDLNKEVVSLSTNLKSYPQKFLDFDNFKKKFGLTDEDFVREIEQDLQEIKCFYSLQQANLLSLFNDTLNADISDQTYLIKSKSRLQKLINPD
jgi:hypothetical protein